MRKAALLDVILTNRQKSKKTVRTTSAR